MLSPPTSECEPVQDSLWFPAPMLHIDSQDICYMGGEVEMDAR